jgi:hypothetical protein
MLTFPTSINVVCEKKGEKAMRKMRITIFILGFLFLFLWGPIGMAADFPQRRLQGSGHDSTRDRLRPTGIFRPPQSPAGTAR